jgi:hypothetical protein
MAVNPTPLARDPNQHFISTGTEAAVSDGSTARIAR